VRRFWNWLGTPLSSTKADAYATTTPVAVMRLFSIGSVLAAIGTVVYFLYAPSAFWCQVLYACWAIVPPAWFFLEYNLIIWQVEEPKKREPLQDLAKAFWAALLTALALIYVSNFGVELGKPEKVTAVPMDGK
jgi:hypothetical protein